MNHTPKETRMSRKLFLTIASVIAALVGGLSLLAPDILLGPVKAAVANPAALVMARTVGVLLLAVALLAFLVRRHEDSPTMEAVLKANLALQLGILPIDPLAYMSGTFGTLGAFVPNTIVHILLASGFAYYLVQLRKRLAAAAPALPATVAARGPQLKVTPN
jgi:hypothetical protein